MMRNKILYSLLALVIIFSFVACSGKSGDAKAEKPPKKMTENQNLPKAYNFTLTTLEGKTVTLADYKGKVLILDMWDTWCPPCRAEIPHFVELYKQYKSSGLDILGVAFGREGEAAVRKFVADFNINYTSALANQDLMNGYGPVNSIPTTFIIDQYGRIYQKYIGLRPKATFEKDIKTLLNL